MKITPTSLEGLCILEPNVFEDHRGYFVETFNARLHGSQGLMYDWVQDNESSSQKGVLRGLHYQVAPFGQAKLVRVIQGAVYDVAVDIRPKSKTFGQWFGLELNDSNRKQLLIPRGFAHGFQVLSKNAVFAYKCDGFYNKQQEGSIHPFDNSLNINWPLDQATSTLSEKDAVAPSLGNHRPFQ